MIRTQSLAYAYPGGTRLAFADLDLASGGVLLVRGASGRGKSTLLGLLAGLLSPGAGEIWVAGTALGTLGTAARDAWRARTLGVMPQRLHLSASLSVRQNLELPALCAGVAPDSARLEALSEVLGLQGLAARRPAELSVGQAQRVALARALMRRPQVLMADEPTSSLDDEHAESVAGLLLDTARDQGATLVLATHDRRLVEAVRARRAGDATVQELTL